MSTDKSFSEAPGLILFEDWDLVGLGWCLSRPPNCAETVLKTVRFRQTAQVLAQVLPRQGKCAKEPIRKGSS